MQKYWIRWKSIILFPLYENDGKPEASKLEFNASDRGPRIDPLSSLVGATGFSPEPLP